MKRGGDKEVAVSVKRDVVWRCSRTCRQHRRRWSEMMSLEEQYSAEEQVAKEGETSSGGVVELGNMSEKVLIDFVLLNYSRE